jgi:hypothetical protein
MFVFGQSVQKIDALLTVPEIEPYATGSRSRCNDAQQLPRRGRDACITFHPVIID